jgi:predicted DNA-binding ribbon-helix-helix protein
MRSPTIRSRSVKVKGQSTSVSLEDAFWGCLHGIAQEQSITLSDLVAYIDSQRGDNNLSSALRLFVIKHYREAKGDAVPTRLNQPQVLLARRPDEITVRIDVKMKVGPNHTSLASIVEWSKPVIEKARELGSEVEAVAVFGRQKFPIL